MKKMYLLLILICAWTMSCDNNDELTTLDTELSSISNETIKSPALTVDTGIFQTRLQWVSFLVARTLIENDASVKAQFIDAITVNQSNQYVVKLSDLLGGQINSIDFYNAFEGQFWNFAGPSCGFIEYCPGGDDGPLSGEDPGNVGGNCNDNFCIYLSIILEENCLEIYLPNAHDNYMNTISSTAHPLHGSGANHGYKHRSNNTNDISIIDELNVTQFKNLLVARPYVSHTNDYCSYEDYPIDFTLFLD